MSLPAEKGETKLCAHVHLKVQSPAGHVLWSVRRMGVPALEGVRHIYGVRVGQPGVCGVRGRSPMCIELGSVAVRSSFGLRTATQVLEYS